MIWWNGVLHPDAEVRLDPADAGFLAGDGLFETLRADGGTIGDPEAHLDRLFAGLARIGLKLPECREALAIGLAAVAAGSPSPISRLRLTVSRGCGGVPTRLIQAFPYTPPEPAAYEQGVPVVVLPEFRLDSRSPLAGLKSLSYQLHRLALRRAEALGCWEALLLNENGHLVEGSRSNLVLSLEEGFFTPPLADGCLPGTVRRRWLESGRIAERRLTLDDLHAAREVLLLNSLVGALPIGELRGRAETSRGDAPV
jgi:branched-chain amino acid aminotransferase